MSPALNQEKIRKDFPILEEVIYMDSASTSLTPEPVLNSTLEYYRKYNANVGRGIHRLSQLAYQRYRDAHRKVAGFIGAQETEVIFTKNTTESINMIAQGLSWKKDDKVVTTQIEHHSNLLPWMRLKESGVNLDIIKPDKKGGIHLADFEKAVDDNTRMVAVTQASNVLGTILPIIEISEICKEHGIKLLVDGAQSVPHVSVDVKELGCDYLCFSGHKMLGPTGTGVLWMKNGIRPLLLGGGMVEDVSLDGYKPKEGYEEYEAGTPNIAGGIGLGRAVDYLQEIGMDNLRAHEVDLTEKLISGLLEMDNVTVYGPLDLKERGPVVSFNIKGLMPHDVALMLDQSADIMVRSGHHCCIPLMKHLGLQYGTVRASLYLYNTREEIEKLLGSLEMISKMA